MTDTATGKTRNVEQYNLIPTVGKTALAAQMSGDNTTNVGDNLYVAVGDDNTAPSASDTTLGNETYRKVASSTSFSAGVCSIAAFFSA